jgi:hypothetical protein
MPAAVTIDQVPRVALRAATSSRQVVCPDRGSHYGSVFAAVEQIQREEGRLLNARLIYWAIRTGKPYAGRFWDFRYPCNRVEGDRRRRR